MKAASLLIGTALVSVSPAATMPASLPSPDGSVPFSARLAQQPSITGPAAWTPMPRGAVWRALAGQRDRQPARWDYARSLIAQGLGAEAFGVLEVMRQDDPDLVLVDAFRIAHGAAQVLDGRPAEALKDLATNPDGDEADPERCAWLLRAFVAAGQPHAALRVLSCARPALAARPGAARLPFLIAGGRAAVEAGRPALALTLLQHQPDRDPGANLIRATALAAMGQGDRARFRLARIAADAPVPLRREAELTGIELGLGERGRSPAAASTRLAAFRYGWRGDALEARALRLAYRLTRAQGDTMGAMAAGATLLRYHGADGQAPADLLPELGALMTGAVNDPGVSLPRAAGMVWFYRDMLPVGQVGDDLLRRLADRLQAAGLYDRAAALLGYQLGNRVNGVARGPLSARVAALLILAGHPDRAISILRRTDDPGFTDEMNDDRRRVEAVALDRLGRTGQALAILERVPASEPLHAEILWRARRWQEVSDVLEPLLPATRRGASLDSVGQTIVLRRVVALAMLKRQEALATMYRRYAVAMAGTPSGEVFNLLAGPTAAIDPARISRAMAGLPGDSPAGSMAMLLAAPPVSGT